jgi:hypothetical protein
MVLSDLSSSLGGAHDACGVLGQNVTCRVDPLVGHFRPHGRGHGAVERIHAELHLQRIGLGPVRQDQDSVK